MPRFCSAFGCSNSGDKPSCKEKKISFHLFPLKQPEILKIWLVKMKRDNFNPTKYSLLCSDHFEESEFTYQPFTNRRELKKGAVPTLFSFKSSIKRKRTTYEFGSSITSATAAPTSTLMSVPLQNVCDAACQTDMDVIDTLLKRNAELEKEIFSLKAEHENSKINAHTVTDTALNTLTGFNREQFNVIFEFLNFDEKDNLKHRFFIYLVRLRTGLTEDLLAIFFHVSQSYISKLLTTMTVVIYSKIKPVSIWPSKEQVKLFMPHIFRQNFPECRVIVDSTEFFIQKPSDPVEQQMSFSYYKNSNTVKCMIGITPSGAISFISDTWFGSISDKKLFLECGIMQLLEKNDVVIADRGFLVSKELDEIGCKIITPNFLKGKIQFSFEERKENKKVSKHRIHVERAINRIKNFRLFKGKIPYTLLPQFNELIYIVSFLINFGNPLINL